MNLNKTRYEAAKHDIQICQEEIRKLQEQIDKYDNRSMKESLEKQLEAWQKQYDKLAQYLADYILLEELDDDFSIARQYYGNDDD